MTVVPAPTDASADVMPAASKAALRLVPKTVGIAPSEEIEGRDSYAVTAAADVTVSRCPIIVCTLT
jgi:hypothetical protein